MTLKELFKKHGTPSSDWTEDQRAAFDKDLEAYEAEVRKLAGNRPGPKADPADPAPVQIDPAVQQQIDSISSAVSGLADSVKKLTDHVSHEQKTAEEQKKAASEKKYRDHVAKLLSEGRVSKADHDALLTDEKMQANMAALDVFIDSSAKWAVNPAFVKKPSTGPEKDDVENRKADPAALREQAKAEFASSN